MPADLSFLDLKHDLYQTHEAAWKREEKRLAGGDAVLDELIQFTGEEDDSFTMRKAWARWTGFGRVHTTVLAGHLTSKIPTPNYGALGEVRELGDIEGRQTLAELYHYNCNGVGNDGMQLPAFMDGVEQRALSTAFRWLFEEMPTKESLRAIRIRLGKLSPSAPFLDGPVTGVTEDEIRAGFRPFRVEYSPLCVWNWRIWDGVLCWAVIRVPVRPKKDIGQTAPSGLGYYLVVRRGYTGLDDEFAVGGWWKFDAQKTLTDQGRWDDTDGQIPLWLHIGEPGEGTVERPSIGQSSTVELGQISADLMNAVSEQRYNARQASKSQNWIMGIDPESHAKVVTQQGLGQITVGVPVAKDGQGGVLVPQMWNSSEGAMATEVYKTIIELAKDEARGIMVRQIMAAPDASGARVEAEHASATAPLLVRIAGTAESSWNTGLYFTLRRFGLSHEEASAASVTIPRDFELRNVLDSIDTMLDTMTKAGVSSPTWMKALAIRKGEELDLIGDDDRKAIEEELTAADLAKLTRSKLQAEVVKAWLDAEATFAGAAKEAGLTEEQATEIFGSAALEEKATPIPSPDVAPPVVDTIPGNAPPDNAPQMLAADMAA